MKNQSTTVRCQQENRKAANKVFGQTLLGALLGYALLVLLMHGFVAIGVMKPIPIEGEVVIGVAVLVLGLLYLFQHRRPDGTIGWK